MTTYKKKKIYPGQIDEAAAAPRIRDEISELRPAVTPSREQGPALPKRGRPHLDTPKQQVNIRLDADLLSLLRSRGKGWQTEVNDKLRLLFMS